MHSLTNRYTGVGGADVGGGRYPDGMDETNETSAPRSEREPLSPFAIRCLAWLFLAVVGNITTLAGLFALSQEPVGFEWSILLSAVGVFVLPAYSPALLFFTAVLTVLSRNESADTLSEADRAQGSRMIAGAVRLGLMIVLSFAVVVVIIDPPILVYVMFAVLLSFIAIVRAELIAPPRDIGVDERYRRRAESLRIGEASASEALGNLVTTPDTPEDPRIEQSPRVETGRVGHTARVVGTWIAVVVLVPVAAMLLGGTLTWGATTALSPGFIAMSVASMTGPVVFVLAWLAAADKAESRRSRNWRRGFLSLMATGSIVAISAVFFFSGKNTVWMGIILLAASLLTELSLRTSSPGWLFRARLGVETRRTQAHLQRLRRSYCAAREEWRQSQRQPSPTVRILGCVFTPFVEAARLARSRR